MSLHQNTQDQWVKYNPLTATYDTPDGTKVAQELADSAECWADVLHIANVREKQRNSKQRNLLTDEQKSRVDCGECPNITSGCESVHFIKGDA